MTAAWDDSSLRPLEGGYSGETYLAGVGPDRVVVRIYGRDPERAAVDAALLHLVRGLVPVPEVLELRRPTPTTPAVLVTEYVAGTRLDVALAAEPEWLDLTVVARSLGAVLTALGGMPFLRAAMFADGDLSLLTDPLPGDLLDWAEQRRTRGRLATWNDADWRGLCELVDAAEDLLADAALPQRPRAVLAHGDVNPKNVLVDPATSQVCALLDWEYAHAGSPYTDLGNLCRFERDPRLVEPLLAALTERWPAETAAAEIRAENLLRLGRAMDLWALVDLAGRPSPGPVQDLATELLLSQARSGDLDAWPWPTTRVAPTPR